MKYVNIYLIGLCEFYACLVKSITIVAVVCKCIFVVYTIVSLS